MNSKFDLRKSVDPLRERREERLLEWAMSVFGEPKAEDLGINPRLYELGYISQEQEAILYTDLHSRDSEVGLGLLDWRKAELLDSIAYLKSAIKKREQTAALSRTRRDALGHFTAVQVESQTGQLKAELAAELERLERSLKRELTYLRARGSKMDALERFIQLVGSETALRIPRASEQMLRLFSQSWRGLVKIKSWALHFGDNERLPALQHHTRPDGETGFLLPLDDENRAVFINSETSGYLLHSAEAISLLAEVYREHVANEGLSTDSSWSVAHILVRAVVEFFYFCNFELPYAHLDLAVDPEDPGNVWVYDYQKGWQVEKEGLNSSRALKRIGAEAADLLINDGVLLKCRRDDDLSAMIEETPPLAAVGAQVESYRPFNCSGLSDFDLDPAGQRVKFRMAINSMGRILKALISGQPHLSILSKSSLGGTLETITGMAMLDNRAFSLEDNPKLPDPIARFQELSKFWRIVGRRRAIAMLGENYVKQVTSGLATLGEQAPDHPTFFTMHAGSLPGTMLGGLAGTAIPSLESGLATAVNPFASLGLSDQIRFIDLLMQSWTLSKDLLERLRDVHSQGKLRRVIEGLAPLLETAKENIDSRFNVKWTKAGRWQWIFFSACAPALWEYWIRPGKSWAEQLLKLSPYQALERLLRIFGDVVRLLLVVELSSADVTQSMPIGAESAGQEIVEGLEGFLQEGSRFSREISETVSFYYDPAVRFDSWLAFTSSFRSYLRQMGQDLKVLDAEALLLSSVDMVVSQLEILYPVREPAPEADAEAEDAEAQSEPLPAIHSIDEAQSRRIDYLLIELLGVGDNLTFLKLISLSSRPDKAELLKLATDRGKAIASLLNSAHRPLIFNMPDTVKSFYNFLGGLGEQGLSSGTAAELRPQMTEYFQQAADLYIMLVNLANQIPQLLPEDKHRLESYLKSRSKKESIGFLLLFACDRLLMDIADLDELRVQAAERAETKFRGYMRNQLGGAIEEPSVEIYPIGGGIITARSGAAILSACNVGFEPYWSDASSSYTQALYSRFISAKLALAAELLKSEIPNLKVFVR